MDENLAGPVALARLANEQATDFHGLLHGVPVEDGMDLEPLGRGVVFGDLPLEQQVGVMLEAALRKCATPG